jgi:hypothetical protein
MGMVMECSGGSAGEASGCCAAAGKEGEGEGAAQGEVEPYTSLTSRLRASVMGGGEGVAP